MSEANKLESSRSARGQSAAGWLSPVLDQVGSLRCSSRCMNSRLTLVEENEKAALHAWVSPPTPLRRSSAPKGCISTTKSPAAEGGGGYLTRPLEADTSVGADRAYRSSHPIERKLK